MIPARPHLALLLPLITAVAGCEGGTSGNATSVVRDSAGVQIVENHGPAWTEEERWEVGSTPAVTIGVTEGDYNQLFDDIRGAMRLSDGRILVVNGGTAELRFFDSNGDFLEAAGGRGGGPGEFNRIPMQLLPGPGDTINVLDMPSWNVVRFDGQGTFLDRRPLDRSLVTAAVQPGFHSEAVSLLPGGGFMAPIHEIPPRPEPMGNRRPGGYLVVSASGGTTFLEPFPYNDFSSMAFNRSSLFGIGLEAVALGDNDFYEVSIYTPEGELTRRIRNLRPNRPVRSEDIAARRDVLVGNAPSPEVAAEWGKDFDEADHADSYPAFSALLIDRLGYLWVRHPHPVQVDEDTTVGWDVYGPEGTFLGEISLPAGLFLHDVGEDYVLGVSYDSLGVQRVQLHTLARR